MKIMQKIVSSLGLAAFCLALIGCFGGNGLIASFQGSVTLFLIGAILLKVGGVDYLFKNEGHITRWSGSIVALAAIVVFCGLSVLVNLESYERPFKDFKKLRYEVIILVLLLIPNLKNWLAQSVKLQKLGFWSAWTGVVVVIISGLIALSTGFHPLLMSAPTDPTSLDGISGTLMTFAYTLQFFVLLSAALVVDAMKQEGWTNRIFKSRIIRVFFFFFTFVLLATALYLTYRRGPAIGVFIGGIVLLVLARNLRLWICFGFIVAFLSIIALRGETRHLKNVSISSGINLGMDDNIRLSQWKTASLTFFDHPLFGIGHRQFEKQCSDLKEKYGIEPDFNGTFFHSHAHNNYFEAFASSGFFGGVAFLGFCLFWMNELVRSNISKLYFLPVVICFVVSGFFECTFTDSEVLHTILLIYFVSQVSLDREAGNGSLST